MLVRVTVEMLLRTGLRVSEFTSLPADAVVLIGAGPWLHVPVGKLHEDRYLPLHPQLLTLIDGYRAAHVPAGHRLSRVHPVPGSDHRRSATVVVMLRGSQRRACPRGHAGGRDAHPISIGSFEPGQIHALA